MITIMFLMFFCQKYEMGVVVTPNDVPDNNLYIAMQELTGDTIMYYPDSFEGIQFVDLSYKGINDPKGVEFFLDAIVLNLSHNEITQYPSNINSLAFLDLSHNYLFGHVELYYINGIRGINLEYNQIQSLSTIGTLNVDVSVSYNNLFDLYWLKNFHINGDLRVYYNYIDTSSCESVYKYRTHFELILGQLQRTLDGNYIRPMCILPLFQFKGEK